MNTNWDYKVISDDTVSKLWERQIVEIIDPNNKLRKKIIVGNIYRPPYNSLDNLNTFMAEFNSTLLEYHANGQNTYMCGDYNVDLLKFNSLQFNENYLTAYCRLVTFRQSHFPPDYLKTARLLIIYSPQK